MAKHYYKTPASRDAPVGESKSLGKLKAVKYVVRDVKSAEYVRLKDGRKIVEPPSGGKLKKRDIERAVRAVVERRRASEVS